MNERIMEIANSVPGSHDASDEFCKKFAELIVTECGRYLDSPEFIGRRDLDWTMVLNEHFGIK